MTTVAKAVVSQRTTEPVLFASLPIINWPSPDSRGKPAITQDSLDADQPLRAQTWRKEGWSEKGYESMPGYRPSMGSGQTDYERTAGSHQATSQQSTSQQSKAQAKDKTAGEEAIPIVEEQLRVGKREVGGGRVRVRSYVVEEPVSEQVSLRDEHVTVERRAVDPSHPLGAGEDAFRERTIEADERREEAVVNKEARVKEEVVVRKDAQQRTETVSDKVRRTEVEVDDQTGGKRGLRKGERGAG